MKNTKSIKSINLKGKRVFLRVDLNIPLKDDGTISDLTRIKAILPTIEYALCEGAFLILCSHLGRPVAGSFEHKFSLEPVAKVLETMLKRKVVLLRNWISESFSCNVGEIILLENSRFYEWEMQNDYSIAQKISDKFDVYINDAFATAHRKETTTHQLALASSVKGYGLLFEKEIQALTRILDQGNAGTIAIVGGAKVSTKLKLLKTLVKKMDWTVTGGGIANTFLKASGHEVGESLYEPECIDDAAEVIDISKTNGKGLLLPVDFVVSKDSSGENKNEIVDLGAVKRYQMILDFGPKSIKNIAGVITNATKILWNGPLGMFEKESFSLGTERLAQMVASAEGFTVAGGGDTLAAINKFISPKSIDYISTGGGAFMEFIEKDGNLPAIIALSESR